MVPAMAIARTITRRRSEQGMEHLMISELALNATGGFHSFLRISPSTYDDLLRRVEPHITNNDTFMRDAITA